MTALIRADKYEEREGMCVRFRHTAVFIAIALLGSLFLGYASYKSGLPSSLLFEDLLRTAPQLSRPWRIAPIQN